MKNYSNLITLHVFPPADEDDSWSISIVDANKNRDPCDCQGNLIKEKGYHSTRCANYKLSDWEWTEEEISCTGIDMLGSSKMLDDWFSRHPEAVYFIVKGRMWGESWQTLDGLDFDGGFEIQEWEPNR